MSTRTGRDFAIPVFRGGRFDTAALPIDVLSDLAAYRDLIVALAKHLFRQRHPERKRLPKGFIDTFELSIRTIEQGSTIPVLARTGPDSPNLPLINGEDDFTRARDLVEEVLEAGARDAGAASARANTWSCGDRAARPAHGSTRTSGRSSSCATIHATRARST
jgi:hypothetical protein